MSAPPAAPRRATNRRAFGTVDASSPLLQLYCRFVALELALKDLGVPKAQFQQGGHNVFRAIDSLSTIPNPVKTSLATIQTQLSRLFCDDGRRVTPEKYPDLRYLRHTSDFTTDASTDADLNEALRLINALIADLDAHWANQSPPQDTVVP